MYDSVLHACLVSIEVRKRNWISQDWSCYVGSENPILVL